MDVSTDGYRYPKGNTPNQLIPQLSNTYFGWGIEVVTPNQLIPQL